MSVMTLEDAVRRATSLPAQILSIGDRGLLREGFYADITVFDADTIVDTATYEKPHQIAKGIYTVVVNGEIVVDNGKITDARPGMVVRGPGYKASPPNSGSAALSGPSATQAR
jgi:N-acyl-D-amino-acid deacylase